MIMANGSYTYNPADIREQTVSRMRFEIGVLWLRAVQIPQHSRMRKIQAAIDSNSKWKRAKLMLLESLYRRFSYEVNTKTGPLTLELHARAAMWREDYLTLKKEIQQESCSVPRFASGGQISRRIFMQACRRMKGQRAYE